MLRIQSADLFTEITRSPDLLVALELAYQGKLDPRESSGFTQRFGTERGGAMLAEVKRFHGSQEYLAQLFRDSTFDAVAHDLPRYLTMLGGAA